MLKLVFLISGFLIAYHYVIYPVIINVLAGLKSSRQAITPEAESYEPRVSLVIAAFNEEKVIAGKLDNALQLEYPADRFEVIVVADGSDDGTQEVASRYSDRGVKVLWEPERKGKSAALNRGVAEAKGDIVVLSDANNDFGKNAIRALVAPFRNPKVGGVCGLKSIATGEGRESEAGDSLYWRYESAIKQAESDLGSITTADGEIFAVRKSDYPEIPRHVVNDDAYITIALVDKGLRVLYEQAAVSYELASKSLVDDFHVKVRMVSGGFQTVMMHWKRLLVPRDQFAWMFLSHKLLRWLMPWCLLAFLVSSFWYSGNRLVMVVLIAQIVCYVLAAVGWYKRRQPELPAYLYVPMYFVVMNLAAARGLLRFLTGAQTTKWRKAER